MPRHAAILVSTGGEVYTNPALFKQILSQAGSSSDMVWLVIGDSLNRWNLLSVCHGDMDVASRKAVEAGDKWCATFVGVAKEMLGHKLGGIYRWEDWRTNASMNYEQRRREFDRICDKRQVLAVLNSIIEKHTITSPHTFISKIEELKKEKGLLLAEKDFGKLPWEFAMAATLLEYSCRHFQSAKDEQYKERDGFADFLVTSFFPNAYEHQAEETVMLYCCLIPADVRFNVLYYPNKISPVFKKAHLVFAEPEKLMFWETIKVDSKAEDDVERIIRMYFAGITGVNRRDKEMLANLVKPLLAFVTTHKQQDQGALLMTLSGLCCIFPQFVASDKKGYSPAFFVGKAASQAAAELSDASSLDIVHSPALPALNPTD